MNAYRRGRRSNVDMRPQLPYRFQNKNKTNNKKKTNKKKTKKTNKTNENENENENEKKNGYKQNENNRDTITCSRRRVCGGPSDRVYHLAQQAHPAAGRRPRDTRSSFCGRG